MVDRWWRLLVNGGKVGWLEFLCFGVEPLYLGFIVVFGMTYFGLRLLGDFGLGCLTIF